MDDHLDQPESAPAPEWEPVASSTIHAVCWLVHRGVPWAGIIFKRRGGGVSEPYWYEGITATQMQEMLTHSPQKIGNFGPGEYLGNGVTGEAFGSPVTPPWE